MKKIFSLLILSALTVLSCKKKGNATSQEEQHTGIFPESWEGRWKGVVNIFSANGSQNVPLSLSIQPIDSARWSWTLHYEGANQIPRQYELIQDASGWKIDEKNGVVLPQQFLGNRMTSSFAVGGTLLIAAYWLEKDALHMEIQAVAQDAYTKSQTEPEVGSHFIGSLQQARLYRE